MNETDWFPQYYNKENRERYASASSPSPRLLFDQWAHSCVGRKWEIRLPLATSTNDRKNDWVEAFFASYIPSDQSPLESCTPQTPSFLRNISLAARRSGKFSVQKYNDQGELLPEEAFHLSPDCVRPSLASWKNRAREIMSTIFNSSENEMAKNDFETSSIQDEIHSSVIFSVSLTVPIPDEPLGLKFGMNKDSNIELGNISPESIASRSGALLPGDILVKCSSIKAFWKNSPCAFVVEENDCTTCKNEWVVAAYVKSHKDFPHISPYVKMTFRRALTNLVSFHMSMCDNNTDGSVDCSSDIENSILQNATEALKNLLLLKARFNKQNAAVDLESKDISSHLATLSNSCKWLLQVENIKAMLSSGTNEKPFPSFDEICHHVELGSNLVPELKKIFALHKPPKSVCWFVNKFIELHSWLSREHDALLTWLDVAEKMVSLCTNPKNESYFEVHEMVQTLEQATCVDSDNFLSLATKFDSSKKLMDSLSRKVSMCQTYVENLEQMKGQFVTIPPTPFDEVVSYVNSASSSASACTIIDPVLQSLHELHKEISSKPELSNVMDFVVLPHLLEARKWEMKSVYADHSGALLRERLSFYQDLIDTARRNKNDWTEFQILPLISDQWNKIAELHRRVDYTVLFDEEPELQKEATIIEAEEYLSKKLLQNISVVTSPILKEALSLLSRFPVLCILEEKILVWLDVMHLTELVKSDNSTKISLDELSQYLKDSSLIHDGNSPQRYTKIKNLTPNANVNVEVRKFSATFDGVVSSFQETANRWAAEAEQWKASARQFLSSSSNSSVEHARIMQLLTMHDKLHVFINEEYYLLLQQVRTFHLNENNSDDKNEAKEKNAARIVGISVGQDFIDSNSCGSKCDLENIRENGTAINSRFLCDDHFGTNSARHVFNGKSSVKGNSNQSTTFDDVDYGCDSDFRSIGSKDNFSSDSFVMEKTNNVLNCLLKRKALSDECICSNKREKTCQLSSIHGSNELHHRTKTRIHLMNCFTTGVRELGLPESHNLSHEFCCFLAWRLERMVYKKFPWNMSSGDGEDKKNYSAILRCLKSNLKSNRTLCASVLVGNTSLSSLVDYSPKDLASKHILNQREQGAKQAEKQRVIDANDAQFGMVGLLNQKRSSYIHGAANTENKTATELGLFLDQHAYQDGPLEATEKSIGSLVDTVNLGASTVDKTDLNVDSGLNVSYLKQSMIIEEWMDEPNERDHHPLLNVQLPLLETDVEGVNKDFDSKQDEAEHFFSEPDESDDDDELTSFTPLDANEETCHKHINSESPATHFQELRASITGGGVYQIKPKGGGTLFFFVIKEMASTNFKATLYIDKYPEFLTKVEELLPYSLEERRTCSLEKLREFIHMKMRDRHHDILFCRLSFSYTEITNQDKYKAFRRAYEKQGRVAILKAKPRSHDVYLLVPKLLKLLVNEDGISGVMQEKIESTHLMLIVAKSERA